MEQFQTVSTSRLSLFLLLVGVVAACTVDRGPSRTGRTSSAIETDTRSSVAKINCHPELAVPHPAGPSLDPKARVAAGAKLGLKAATPVGTSVMPPRPPAEVIAARRAYEDALTALATTYGSDTAGYAKAAAILKNKMLASP